MNSRRHARETAFQLLYRYDLARQESGTPPPADEALAHDVESHFDHFQVPEELREFASTLINGTLARMTELDALLEAHAKNWKVARMTFVDRNLLRLAAFEILHAGTPTSVAIDEALELGKQFGTAETGPFMNGILDAIAKKTPPTAD